MFAYILGAPRIRDQEMAEEERTSLDSDSVDLVLTAWSMLRSGHYAAFCCVLLGWCLFGRNRVSFVDYHVHFSAAMAPHLVGKTRPKARSTAAVNRRTSVTEFMSDAWHNRCYAHMHN